MTCELFFAIRCEGVLKRIQRVEVAETTIGRMAATNVVCLPHGLVDPKISYAFPKFAARR